MQRHGESGTDSGIVFESSWVVFFALAAQASLGGIRMGLMDFEAIRSLGYGGVLAYVE